MRESYLRTPGRGSGRRAARLRDLPGPSPSPGRALCARVFRRRCVFEGAKCRTEGPSSRFVGYLSLGALLLCEQPAALCSTAAGRPGTKGQQSGQAGQLTFCTVPPRYGYAVVISGCYSSRPCVIFALRAVLALLRSVLGKNTAKPSGQPECGRSGRWRRQCQSSRICSAAYAAAQNPRCQPQTAPVYAPHQRRSVVPQFEGQCLFAKTDISRITVSTALTPLGRSGPGRGCNMQYASAHFFAKLSAHFDDALFFLTVPV